MEYKLSSFTFGDKLSRDDKHLAILRINELRSSCPSDSNFSGQFDSNDGAQFSGELRVLFSKGEFSATDTGSSMDELMDKLSLIIKKQVDLWRDTRFEQSDKFVDYGEKIKKSAPTS